MKRGASGLSLVVGIDKPAGMSSHDAVNRCRRIFGERRVGHTGTLDPFASGVLPVCIGPATRLDAFMAGHDKAYRVRIAFGASTDTDDSQGRVLETGEPDARLRDERFVREYLASLVGARLQVPPVYSAIKVGGKKACDEARKGRGLQLDPRPIEVYAADFLGFAPCGNAGEAPAGSVAAALKGDAAAASAADIPCSCAWDVLLRVSKGTYIRSLARDMGNDLGCPSHAAQLRRLQAGPVSLEDCVSLQELEGAADPLAFALDPVALLGARLFFARGPLQRIVANGGALQAAGVQLFRLQRGTFEESLDSCSSALAEACEPLQAGELVSAVSDDRLAAVYRFDRASGMLKPDCVFSMGVFRGGKG